MEAPTIDVLIRRRDPVTWGQVCDWQSFLARRFDMANRIEAAEREVSQAVARKPMSMGEARQAMDGAHAQTVQIRRSDIMAVMTDPEARLELAGILFERLDGKPLHQSDLHRIAAEDLWEALFFSNEASEMLTAALQGYAPSSVFETGLVEETQWEAT